jgi:hypothetical protein
VLLQGEKFVAVTRVVTLLAPLPHPGRASPFTFRRAKAPAPKSLVTGGSSVEKGGCDRAGKRFLHKGHR